MPQISVVIPTYNRRDRLRACLASLAQQTVAAGEFEVVVAVDGSTDGTEEMLRTLETPYRLHMVVQPQSGQSMAINAGVSAATAPLVLTLDDDMVAAPELVAAHLQAQREHGPVAGIGRLSRMLAPGSDRFARQRAADWLAHYERLATKPASFRDCYSGNLSLPRATFEEVGGFAADVPVEKDTEFALRLQAAGLGFAYVPDAVAVEDNREGWREICHETEHRGELTVELYRRHPALLPESELGGRESLGRSWLALRRLLLALRVPPLPLAFAGRALPDRAARPWFRLVYSLAYWRGVRRAAEPELWARLRQGTLILLYHGVGGPGEPAGRYVVPESRLARQLRWLKRRYTVISLEEYLRSRRAFELPPPKSVILTFDDGYVDNATRLRPLLDASGLTATVFLVTAGGESNGWSRPGEAELAGRSLLTLAQAAAAESGALRFGAHTRTHPRLPDLDAASAEEEIAGARADLERALGRPVETFAYPYGKLDAEVRALVERAGYGLACGVEPGRNRPASDTFALQRIEIHGTYRFPRFALTLWLGDLRRRA